MKTFRNKAQKNGYIFGKVCIHIGVMLILLSTCVMTNDTGCPINILGVTMITLGYILFRYGYYRTGGEL